MVVWAAECVLLITVGYFACVLRSVITDSTGLGKTASMIGLIMSEDKDSAAGPTLVVVPTHLAQQWADEVVSSHPLMMLRYQCTFSTSCSQTSRCTCLDE